MLAVVQKRYFNNGLVAYYYLIKDWFDSWFKFYEQKKSQINSGFLLQKKQ